MIAVDGEYSETWQSSQLLSDCDQQAGGILVQEVIYGKTNEIPVFQEILAYLDIESKTVTADMMHCQREICGRVIQHKKNYLFGLKENQLLS